MEFQIPNKSARYIDLPSPQVLEMYLSARRPAMPAEIRSIAITAAIKALAQHGGRHRDGTLLTEWAPFVLGYAESVWRNNRLH
jgi:hypothetical protein